ncbi:MAG TPA: bifunctional 4-hydroxy-2-oxoglutarate aldolase/2-dehydro-3-deoxy-phosphogluconate aldolase [Marmoricola sp.]
MPTATRNRPAPSPQLSGTAVMAILRSADSAHVEAVARTLVEAGVTCLELTLTIPGALDLLPRLREALPAGLDLGIGTVTSAEEARAAVDAGAHFLVCPTVSLDVLEVATASEVPCYPGAWTPTEVLTAWRAGATAVKLFPAATGGPAHLRRLRDPLPDIPILPTGGVALDHVDDYLKAGAFAVGLGSPLIGDALAGGDLDALADRARTVLGTVAASRSGR